MTYDEKLVEVVRVALEQAIGCAIDAEEATAALRAIDASGTYKIVEWDARPRSAQIAWLRTTLEAANETIGALIDGRDRAEKRIAELETRLAERERDDGV